MAQPMSAAFRAGASLTPSPVMAATRPWRWQAFTSSTLWAGDTRAKTLVPGRARARAASSIRSRSSPVRARSPGPAMPTRLAMAKAVAAWSPVIITGVIPALLHWATASFTPGLGGSSKPMSPAKTRPFSKSLSSRGRSSLSR